MALCYTEPVLNIVVVGFHHKKGCQVEHCYPALVPDHPNEVPAAWKHLPALALPDGSHNYLSDTIFFNLPGLTESEHTVYGISCFRQIPIEQVVQKTDDMTRSSVQKSVCVLCRYPLFGRIAVKMELVVRAWFHQADFSQTQLLEDAYKHLNSCPIQADQILEGIPAQHIVEMWKHKTVLLFKLLLLRRRVVVYGSAAGPLSSAVLALISLLPLCIEEGLKHSANVKLSASPNKEIAQDITNLEQENHLNGTFKTECVEVQSNDSVDESDIPKNQNIDEPVLRHIDKQLTSPTDDREEKCKSQRAGNDTQSLPRDMSIDGLNSLTCQIDHSDCGFPLPLFEDGYICLPYLSLQYLDILSDKGVKGFVVGASNVLFKQKRQYFDALVELNEMKIETSDLALRRQLTLGTEDLRFADHVVRFASTQGDAWIRDQFASYLIYLLRTSLLPEGSREIEPYNAQFMSAFKATPTYDKWLRSTNNGNIEAFMNLVPAHPFAGQLSVADMKLKIAHTMSTTEGGRKVSAAVASTGRAVATTSRAVGGALSQAKGALSGWWSSLTAPPNDNSTAEAEEAIEASDKVSLDDTAQDAVASINNIHVV